jgi:hypothetical protein
MLDLRKSSSALMSVFLFVSSSFVVANADCKTDKCDGPEIAANPTSDSGEAVPCDSSKEDCSSKDSSQYSYNGDSDHDSDQEGGSGHGGTHYSQAEEQGKDNGEESKSSDESGSYGA